MVRTVALAALLAAAALGAAGQPPSPGPAGVLAPSGRLRAAINFGNPVLAQRSAAGDPDGVSVDLARELAVRLGVPLDLVTYDAAGQVAAAATSGDWDVAFLAVDPARAVDIAYTAPYVIIEGGYLVRDASPLQSIDDFDREGVRIAVGAGSGYDLHLTRTLTRATLVRAPTSPAAVDSFLDQDLEAAAGIRAALVQYAAERRGVRVIPGRFMVIEQAMGIPRGRAAALPYLRAFVEEMKASGFVAAALARTRQRDATVAPPAPE